LISLAASLKSMLLTFTLKNNYFTMEGSQI